MTSSEAIARIDEAWDAFRGAVERLGAEGLERQTSSGWTAKELVAHVAFWQEAFEYVLVAMFRKGEPRPDYRIGSGYWPEEGRDWPPADEHNAREAEWARSQTPETVLARLDAARARHRELVSTVTDAELEDDWFGKYMAEEADHLNEHRPELEALLA